MREALRLHRYHCQGCGECREVSERLTFGAALPGPATIQDMEAFGSDEDYEGRESR